MNLVAIALAALIGLAGGYVLARRRPAAKKEQPMPTTIRAKRGDTTFVPLVQFADYAAGVRADLTGRDITATAQFGRQTIPVAVDVVDAVEGEVIVEITPPTVGDWTVDVAGLDATFTVTAGEDVTNG